MPNRITIDGSGTSVPPVELVVVVLPPFVPPFELEVEVEDDVDDDVLDEVISVATALKDYGVVLPYPAKPEAEEPPAPAPAAAAGRASRAAAILFPRLPAPRTPCMNSTDKRAGCALCIDAPPLDFEFSYAFQPIVDVHARRIFAHEGLVRGTSESGAGPWLALAEVEKHDYSPYIAPYVWSAPALPDSTPLAPSS